MSVPLLLPLILGMECLARDCMGENKETQIGLRLGLLALGSSKNACAWLVQERLRLACSRMLALGLLYL